VVPEALDGGPIAKVRDGDMIRLDATSGALEILTEGVLDRASASADLSAYQHGTGREMFGMFRRTVTSADTGATVFDLPTESTPTSQN
jgi:phosphogluconate dehydratase